ncbi:MAG: FtsX-like permease family protein [Acidobacteriota bacterium]
MDIGPILRAMKHSKFRFGVIVAEIALTLAIGLNCGVMILKARADMAQPSGFDDKQLLHVSSRPFEPAFAEKEYVTQVSHDDRRVIESVEGVEAASNTRFLPWQGGGSSQTLRVLGAKTGDIRTQIYPADESTLKVLGSRLIAGKWFSREEVEQDIERISRMMSASRPTNENGRVLEPLNQDIVISKRLAQDAFGVDAPLGKLLEDESGDTYRVVGVIDSFFNPYIWPEINERVVFYMGRSSNPEISLWLVRAAPGRTNELAATLTRALEASNKGRNVRVTTILEEKSQYHGMQIMTVWLMSILIMLLVFVTALGIAGLTSFSVAERTRQIGTRRALGARRLDILAYFLTETSLVTALGIAIGIVLAYGLNMLLMDLTGGSRIGLGELTCAVVGIWLIGLTATYFPARRGAALSPVIATRSV